MAQRPKRVVDFNLWFTLLLFVGIGATEPTNAYADDFYELRVGKVFVAPTRPGLQTGWDMPKEDVGGFCDVIAVVGETVTVATTAKASPAAGKACRALSGIFVTTKQRERDPQAPDLFLRLNGYSLATWRTGIARDSVKHGFDVSWLLPVDSVPSSGVELEVYDQDGDDISSSELISSILIPKSALETQTAVIVKDDSLERVDIVLSKRTLATQEHNFGLKAKAGRMSTGVPVFPGSTVRIASKGVYKLGTFAGSSGPAGLSGYSSYNYEALANGKHGAALAFVADAAGAMQIVETGACGEFVSRYSGILYLGINDSKFDDNVGKLQFKIRIEPPTNSSMKELGRSGPCLAKTLSRQEIVDGLSRIRSQVLSCGDSVSTVTQFKMKISIDGEGAIKAASDEDQSSAVIRCVRKALEAATFPKSESGASITYPFIFRPRVKLGLVTVESPNDHRLVAARVRKFYLPEILKCHQRLLKVDAQTRGKLQVLFTVSNKGAIDRFVVQGFDSSMDACIKRSGDSWRFAAQSNSATPTEYEFSLQLKPGK